MDAVARVELKWSYGAEDGWTRSGVASTSIPKKRSGKPRLDQSSNWEKYRYDKMLVLVISTSSYDSITYYHGLPYLLPTCFSFIAAL